MLRAVLDANVIASGFIRPQGHSGQILRRFVESKEFEVVTSAAILDEIRRVLRYPRLRKELPYSNEEIEARVASLGLLSDIVEEGVSVRVVEDDPDDDKYLSAALAGKASHVVSGDRHLVDIGEFEGIRILRPRAFIELLDTRRST